MHVKHNNVSFLMRNTAEVAWCCDVQSGGIKTMNLVAQQQNDECETLC